MPVTPPDVNLQLAKRFGLSKSHANTSYLHSWRDISTSFVIYVTRLLMHTIPLARDDRRILFNTLWANIGCDDNCLSNSLSSNDISTVSQPDDN
jgi:hypothetical protein